MLHPAHQKSSVSLSMLLSICFQFFLFTDRGKRTAFTMWISCCAIIAPKKDKQVMRPVPAFSFDLTLTLALHRFHIILHLCKSQALGNARDMRIHCKCGNIKSNAAHHIGCLPANSRLRSQILHADWHLSIKLLYQTFCKRMNIACFAAVKTDPLDIALDVRNICVR